MSVEKAVVARMNVRNQKFEILVDPEKALEVKRGKTLDLNEVLAYPAIYSDARKGELAPTKDLQTAFGTTDVSKIAERIIKEGMLQLTTEQRRKMIEQKKMQIATIISKRGINPQTNTPHPPQRILNAMEEVGVRVDPFVDAEAQVSNVLKEIRKMLPIKLEKVSFSLRIPPQFSGRAYPLLKRFGEIKSENWLTDGSLQVEIEVLAGVQDEFFKKLSDLTHGQFESKLLRKVEI